MRTTTATTAHGADGAVHHRTRRGRTWIAAVDPTGPALGASRVGRSTTRHSVDAEGDAAMDPTRCLVEQWSARSAGKVKTRQPLEPHVGSHRFAGSLTPELIAEIDRRARTRRSSRSRRPVTSWDHPRKAPCALGKRFGKQTLLVAKAIAEADATARAASLAARPGWRLSPSTEAPR